MKLVNVRFPDELHARIKEAAAGDRRSLNAEILWLIERGLSQRGDTTAPETPPARN